MLVTKNPLSTSTLKKKSDVSSFSAKKTPERRSAGRLDLLEKRLEAQRVDLVCAK